MFSKIFCVQKIAALALNRSVMPTLLIHTTAFCAKKHNVPEIPADDSTTTVWKKDEQLPEIEIKDIDGEKMLRDDPEFASNFRCMMKPGPWIVTDLLDQWTEEADLRHEAISEALEKLRIEFSQDNSDEEPDEK